MLILSHSRKKTFQHCHRLHYWKYEERLYKPDFNIHFIFGTAIDKSLEHLYKTKETKEVHAVFYQYMDISTQNEKLQEKLNEYAILGDQLLSIYIEQYNKENIQVIDVQKPFYLGVHYNGDMIEYNKEDLDKLNNEELFFIIAGKLDMVAQIDRLDGLYYIWDNKTTSQDKESFKLYCEDNQQFIDYSIYGKFKYGNKFGGVIINGLNKKYLKDKTPIFRLEIEHTEDTINGALQEFIEIAQEYYLNKSVPGLDRNRNEQFGCKPYKWNEGCEFYEPCFQLKRNENYTQTLDLFYAVKDKFDWEE